MTASRYPSKSVTKRMFLSTAGALSTVLGVGSISGLVLAQSQTRPHARVRIPTTATGQAAIGRVRGRLQISYDDLGLRYGAPIYLRLIKDQKRLEVWVRGRQQAFVRLRSYRLCGSDFTIGPRISARLPKQPEGFYALTGTSMRPAAVAYLGLDLNWPNMYDRANGWNGATSLIQAGCASQPHFGLTDQDMEEVYALVYGALANGQPSVACHIFPFAMSGLRMVGASNAPNAAFWRDLAPAWQMFERTKKPPQVTVLGRRYVVREG